MVGALLLRGMLTGLFAGLLVFGFARVFGEPEIERAIAFEQQMAQGTSEAQEPALVSRETQAGVGLASGVLVYSASIGGLFALIFAFVNGRIGSLGPRGTSALLAISAFVAISIAPFLKYPANPPSVGDPDTIGVRTGLYFVMVIVSVAALAGAVAAARQLAPRLGVWNAAILAGVAFIGAIAVASYALPEINEIPAQFSAPLLWRFRIASLGLHALLWATIGLVFGWLMERGSAQIAVAASAVAALRTREFG
ncbi:conserved hypothetical protein [Methylocella silvestris BL2]|uniref:Cobalt transporter n=1 Tax=Methylocella silvestris (strain DSM 15510 / CIP 108128 / LMG 27833 / NCIMB 13906 / BL2) TaxID=395965 RepID=B8ETK1_METSB|nr:CbtA family protein [Methylocella silvestris]ACK52353.1 conserved hypothetical protein [Methylocella silvestris BL2]